MHMGGLLTHAATRSDKVSVLLSCCLNCAGIEDLREKREQVLKQIQDDENEKAKIQTELATLTQRLARVNGASGLLLCSQPIPAPA
jgi:hypothetical protein